MSEINNYLFMWMFRASALFVLGYRSKNKSCDMSVFSVSLFAFSQFVIFSNEVLIFASSLLIFMSAKERLVLSTNRRKEASESGLCISLI